MIQLLIAASFCAHTWAKPPSVRIPTSTESFRVARTAEILKRRGVESLENAWSRLTPEEQAEVRIEERTLTRIDFFTQRILERTGAAEPALPALARDQVNVLAADLVKWSGVASPEMIAALTAPLSAWARTANQLNIHDLGRRARYQSLQERLEQLAEGVSLNTQRALRAAHVTHDEVALREAEAATVRLIAEAYLITGRGHARPIFHAATKFVLHSVLALIPVLATHELYLATGWEKPWIIGTFVSSVLSVLIPIDYFMVYVRPEAKLWLYPERVRAFVNRILLGDLTQPSFWPLVQKKLELALARDPAPETSPIKLFLSTWSETRASAGQTLSFLSALSSRASLRTRQMLSSVFPGCAAALEGAQIP